MRCCQRWSGIEEDRDIREGVRVNITKETIRDNALLLPKYSAVYRISDGAFKTLYVSDRLHALLKMTQEEYDRFTGDNALDIVLPQDREGLNAAIKGMLETGDELDFYYRVHSNRSGFD